MQPDPVDSTKMIPDHRWDEQDQYEFDKCRDRLMQLKMKLELLGTVEQLHDYHEHLKRMCKLKMCKLLLLRLHEQENLNSLQRKWETGEGLNRLVMEGLQNLGKEQGFEKLPQEEIERLFKLQTERNIKETLERHMCRRWADHFQQSLGVQGVQDLPDDLPEFRRQIERLRRQTLQNWQHELLRIEAYLSLQKEFDKFSRGVETNNDFSSIYVPNSVRVQAQGSHTNMEENVRTTVGSLGCAGDESSPSLAVPTSEHLRLNSPGGEGSDVPRSNHAPTITSSTEANSVPLVDQLTANQSQDKRKFYLTPKFDNQLEDKHKSVGGTSDSHKKSVAPKSIIGMIVTSVFFVSSIVFGGAVFRARPESGSPEPGTIHKFNIGEWIEWIRTSIKRSCSGPFNTWTKKKTCNPRHGKKGFVLHSADVKGNRVRKNISVISRAGSGGSSPERTSSTLTAGGNNKHSYNDKPVVILDNQAQANCTGMFSVLSNLTIGRENIVLVAANGGEMPTIMSGSVCLENFKLPNVHYAPDLGDRIIVSGSILDKDGYGYECGQGKCTVKDLKNNNTIVGKGQLVDGNYILDFLTIARAPEQRGLLTTVWNGVCSALHRLGLKY